ncbi:MAG TPA: selenium-binding protein SBP56-related protein [Candidatus Acidoferrum sp.]|nr:selenium-binding protein SBP56-related protein [Candidatus Acidoferrum sp.]
MILKNKHIRLVIDGVVAQGAGSSRHSESGAGSKRNRTRVLALLISLTVIGLLFGLGANHASARVDSVSGRHGQFEQGAYDEKTLIVWAGDKAHVAPDFITVIDFDERSSSYGKVLRTLPLTGPSAIGNEPHHVGLSADGKTFVVGGLLSVLRGQDQVFFFDVSHPREPQFIRSDNPSGASIADEFDSLSNGGFFGTFMGSPDGANPGRLVEYDAHQQFVQAWPLDPPADGFDPHGLAIDEARNLIVTSDFVCPLHTLLVPGGGEVILRGTVRVWDFAKRSIVRTIVVGDPANPSGTIDVGLIPGDRQLRAFTAGMADNKLYLIDTQHGTATPVYDFGPFAVPNAPTWPQLFRITNDGTRLFITLNYAGNAGKVVQFDISNPEHPRVLSFVDLGPGSGPHYLRLTKDEKRLVVSDYFLVEDLVPAGVVKAEGDHKIHVFEVGRDQIKLDPRFDLDFNRDISTGPARPHGFVFLPAGSER